MRLLLWEKRRRGGLKRPFLPMDLEQKTLARERQKLAAVLASLEGDLPLSSRELHTLWDSRARPFWRAQPQLYRALADKCRGAGENFLAIEVAQEGLAWSSRDFSSGEYLQLIHLCALAYASVGAPDRARELIQELGGQRGESCAALALLAQTHRDWAEETGDGPARREHLRQALAAYRRALELESNSRLAIDAAGSALLLGPDGGAEASALARRALDLHGSEPRRPGAGNDFEWSATGAEAQLILGDFAGARASYIEAGKIGRHRRFDLLASRKQARLLLRGLGRDPHELDGCFPLPRVALFAGHMIDLPGRPRTRFPEDRVTAVRARIAAALEEHNVLIGYGSAACGSDLLFLRAVLDRPGGEIHVVLPFERSRFLAETVVRLPAHQFWGEEFHRVLAAAASVTELTDSPCWFEGNALAFGNRVLHGLAERKAREFGDELLTFAVWDGHPHDERLGGTADSIRHWAARGRTRVLIPPDGAPHRVETHCTPHVAVSSLPANADGQEVREEIYAILSGDWEAPAQAVRSGDRPALEAVQAFFRRVAGTLAQCEAAVLHRWVDGSRFRLIFGDLAAAGQAALALREQAAGDGRLRLGLHAGPVTRWRNPLLGDQEEPAGIHLGKAERLAELPFGARVYVSREYAALLAAAPVVSDGRGLHCVYQGSMTLGERFGRQELFILEG
jgi:tetratricopeptide (TPR) repeat protein